MNNANIIDIRVTAKDLASGVLKDVNKSLGGFSGVARTAINVLKGVGIAITSLGALAIKGAGDFEQVEIAFKVMLGSAERAKTLLAEMDAFAKKTPFELPQLQEAGKQLLAYNFQASEIIPTLETIGNIAAGVGQDKLPILIRALGQIKGKGQLKGQELMQLTETGLPVADMLAKRIGVSVQELNDNVSDLNIPFETVLATIKDIEKNRFADLMSQQSKTLFGTLSNVKDTLTTIFRNFGQQSGLLDAAKSSATALYNTLANFATSQTFANLIVSTRQLISLFGNAVKNTLVWISTHKNLIIWVIKAIAVIGTMAVSIQVASKATLMYSTFTKFATSSLKGLTVQAVIAKGAMGLLGLAIAGVAMTMAKYSMFQQDVGTDVEDLTTAFGDLGTAGTDATEAIAGGAGNATNAFKDFKKAVKEEKEAFNQQLADIVKNARERITSNKEALAQEEKDFAESQKNKTDSFKKEQLRLKDENDQRVKNLEETMKQYVVVGSSTYNEDLLNYKKVLAKVKDEGNQRMADAELTFKSETEKEKTEYEKRTNELKAKITEDEAMLQKHSSLIKTIKINESRDEIQILRDTHAKRLKEIEEQYKKESSMAGGAGTAVGKNFGKGLNEEMDKSLKKFNESIAKAMGTSKIEFNKLEIAVLTVVGVIGSALGNKKAVELSSINNQIKKSREQIEKEQKLIKAIPGLGNLVPKEQKSVLDNMFKPKFASGIDVVPRDMEAVIHKGEAVVPASKNPNNPNYKGRASNGVAIVNNFYNSFVDANALSSRLSFQLRNR